MSFRPVNSTYRKKDHTETTRLVVVGILIVVLYFWGFGLLGWLFRPVSVIFLPISEGNNFLARGLSNFGDFWQAKRSLVEDNRKLKEENLNLKLNFIQTQSLVQENFEFKKLLGRTDKVEMPIVAQVIFTPNLILNDSLILDAGSVNAVRPVKVGDFVVHNNVLIGQIAEVYPAKSKVKLLSAYAELPVAIGDKNVPAMAKGLSNGSFSISLPKDVAIKKGDSIIIPGWNNYFIGQVEVITKKTSDPFQTILFRSPINIVQLKWLEIYAGKN
ncbi:MAG: rod shape-determining protein MreC [Candidatus Vogelbacteria bacterium]|nr:rod shape-determining protein MreC [Candidatus Vogelbacteria bacterium]